MSRIDELKKQYKEFALCDLDIMKMAVPNQANKYTEMLAKLTKNDVEGRLNKYDNQQLRGEYLNVLISYGIDYNYLETLDTLTLYILHLRLDNIGRDKMELLNKFAQFNERKLIDNNDVTSYSSWNEVESAVAVAELKLVDKELAKQIVKVYEDDTWLSLKPLSLEASMKYGANTKWCTTTNTGQYYARYSDRGILIYNINKKTGYKVACFKNLHPEYDVEFSWWDVTDRRIDALESELPTEVLIAVRKNITEMPCYNSALMTQEEQDKLQMYKEGNYRFGEELPDNQRLIISGGFGTTIGTNTTYTFNPSTSTFTTTGTSVFTSGNIGMATTSPNTQLRVSGDVEIDGDLILRSEGEERMRITSEGDHIVTAPDGQRYVNGLMKVPPLDDDAQQRLDEFMAEQLAAANERVAEKHLSLLDNIELGTVQADIIRKMQQLAGIQTREQRLAELDAERQRIEREAMLERINADMAKYPVVHLSLWNKIKNTGRKLSRPFTSRLRKQIGALPKSESVNAEVVDHRNV